MSFIIHTGKGFYFKGLFPKKSGVSL